MVPKYMESLRNQFQNNQLGKCKYKRIHQLHKSLRFDMVPKCMGSLRNQFLSRVRNPSRIWMDNPLRLDGFDPERSENPTSPEFNIILKVALIT